MLFDVDHKYLFTNNWFDTTARQLWESIVLKRKPERYLEIGTYEGASLIWMIENCPWLKEAHCIDAWEGGGDIDPARMKSVKENFGNNIAQLSSNELKKVYVYEQRSFDALAKLINEGHQFDGPVFNYFDMIYIDGSHKAINVLQDAVMAWPLLSRHGLMFFDDYLWKGDYPHKRPKVAIDAFCNVHLDDCSIVASGPQVVIQKLW